VAARRRRRSCLVGRAHRDRPRSRDLPRREHRREVRKAGSSLPSKASSHPRPSSSRTVLFTTPWIAGKAMLERAPLTRRRSVTDATRAARHVTDGQANAASRSRRPERPPNEGCAASRCRRPFEHQRCSRVTNGEFRRFRANHCLGRHRAPVHRSGQPDGNPRWAGMTPRSSATVLSKQDGLPARATVRAASGNGFRADAGRSPGATARARHELGVCRALHGEPACRIASPGARDVDRRCRPAGSEPRWQPKPAARAGDASGL